MDRNCTNPRRNRYALVKLREVKLPMATDVDGSADGSSVPVTFVPTAALDFGGTPDTDFFVVRLKDKYAFAALKAYGQAALADGEVEYADEVLKLATKAKAHPRKRKPD